MRFAQHPASASFSAWRAMARRVGRWPWQRVWWP